jgi:hypothetical protein
MKSKRPRAPRYPFVALATLTDLESGRQTQENTCDLSLFGCQVIPGNTTPTGTRVRIRIVHNGESLEALGRVTHVRDVMGVGIAFTRVEDHCQLVLDKWIAELRDKKMAKQIVSS